MQPNTTPRGADGAAALLTRLTPESLAAGSDLRAQWGTMASSTWNPYALYQSPAWFDHVLHTGREELLPPLAVLDQAHLRGLVLPYRKRHLLAFEVRQYALWRCQLRTLAFLGCEPFLPRNDETYDALLAGALEMDPRADGIYLHSVPMQGFLWGYLQRSAIVAQNLRLYIPHKVRRFHAIELPATFDEYLATQFRKKKRYNLKRQLRLLEEHTGGKLELKRIETPEEAHWFAKAATTVSARSWQSRWMVQDTFESLSRPAWLADLAVRGLLRSYVLLCAGTPCAMVLGCQADGTFHYSETSYDESFAAFSPGGVLLYLLIADLFAERPPRWVSFGIGDSHYKEEFANRHWDDASVLLLRRNARCTMIRNSHACFRGAVDWVKQWKDRNQKRAIAYSTA